jgi:HAD superfamily hydrolase (TIGR01450 family)
MAADATQPASDIGSTNLPGLYDVYVFDLDGTIYLGDDLLPGADRMIEALRRRGRAVRFLSNNPTKDTARYVEKLNGLGLGVTEDDIAGTVKTMADWLADEHPDAVVYPISEQALKDGLAAAGIAMSDDPSEIDIVIASYDRTFTYEKLQIAFDAIWFHRRAFLVGTNPDRFCPFPGGRGEPDCAAIVAAIEACTGTSAHRVLGKPDPEIFHSAIRGLDVDPADCIVVGDRLTTDIKLAHNAGAVSAAVLTGETTAADLEGLADDERPTYVVDRVDRLLPDEVWEELGWDEGGRT